MVNVTLWDNCANRIIGFSDSLFAIDCEDAKIDKVSKLLTYYSLTVRRQISLDRSQLELSVAVFLAASSIQDLTWVDDLMTNRYYFLLMATLIYGN